MIIGRDFFVKHKAIVDHSTDSMTINGIYVKLNVSKPLSATIPNTTQVQDNVVSISIENQLKLIYNELTDIKARQAEQAIDSRKPMSNSEIDVQSPGPNIASEEKLQPRL